MADAQDVMLVLTTLGDEESAERFVSRLVDERLIACGNLVPGLTSIYRWKGEIARDGEVLVLMKTVRERVDELLARAAELHPYDVPELLSLPVAVGAAPYCRWVGEETSKVGT